MRAIAPLHDYKTKRLQFHDRSRDAIATDTKQNKLSLRDRAASNGKTNNNSRQCQMR
jgi:hypothetical protein